MSRPNPTPLLEEALAAWLAGTPAASALGLSSAVAAEDSLVTAALAGHSPSARALANTSDLVAAVAQTAERAGEPAPPALGDRILRSALAVRREASRPATALARSPNEAVGLLHAQAEDAERLELFERLGARGASLAGAREAATDDALAHLLEQIRPFLGFDVVFVSAVVGPHTIHRVHRGFPEELGNMDVIPRELSFCTHTVSAGVPFAVEDAGREAFFRRSLLVQKLGARSYLGVPLFSQTASGAKVALGALCGISGVARTITEADITLTRCFARVAEALVAHDSDTLANLIDEPEGYPNAVRSTPAGETRAERSSAGARSVVYASGMFDDLINAERARGASTRLLSGDEAAWGRLSGLTLPNAVVTGELSGAFRGLLLPKLARFEPDVAAALAALVREKALAEEELG